MTSNSHYLLKDFVFHIPRVDSFLEEVRSMRSYRLKELDTFIANPNQPYDDGRDQDFIDFMIKYFGEFRQNGGVRIYNFTLSIMKRKDKTSSCVIRAEVTKKYLKRLWNSLPSTHPDENGLIRDLKLRLYGKIMMKNQSKRKTYHTRHFNVAFDLQDIWNLEEGTGHNRLVAILDDTMTAHDVKNTESGRLLKVVISAVFEWTKSDENLPLQINKDKFMQQLFANEPTKDFTLVADNGVEVKCHKLVLTVHSPVFTAMLDPIHNSSELQSGQMEMSGMGEDALKYFIKYLYGFEMATAHLTCGTALQLLQNAHYYHIDQLAKAIKIFLLKKKKSWFKADVSLEIYFFTRNIQEFEGLRDLSFEILTERHEEVRQCDKFKELNPSDALDLVWRLHDFNLNDKAKPTVK